MLDFGHHPISPPFAEVDYLKNPTEVVQWMNRKQWTNAISRIREAPDEARTWVISKNEDGTRRWSYLPIHLACMDNPHEELVESLLAAYPEGAKMEDPDKGMLPIHYACDNGTSQRVVEILVQAYPCSVDKRDALGRTPELIVSMSHGVNKDGIIRALRRRSIPDNFFSLPFRGHVNQTCDTQAGAAYNFSRNHNPKNLSVDPTFPQKKIMKTLETNLNTALQSEKNLLMRLSSLEKQLLDTNSENIKFQKHIERLTKTNIEYRSKMEEQEHYPPHPIQTTIVTLQSQVKTSKVTQEALESRLQSKFASENLLSCRISELQSTLENDTQVHNAAIATYRQTEGALRTENASLRTSVKKLSQNNTLLTDKTKDLTSAVINLVTAMNAMSKEQETVIEVHAKVEEELCIAFSLERENLVRLVQSQREYMNTCLKEEENILIHGMKMEEGIRNEAERERKKVWSSIVQQKKTFVDFSSSGACAEPISRGVVGPFEREQYTVPNASTNFQ